MLVFTIGWFLPAQLLGQKIENRMSEEQVSEEGMFIEAKKKKMLGDLVNGAKLFELLLEKYRNHDVAAYELAEIHLINGDYEEAKQMIGRAIEIDQTNEWYHLLKAEISMREEDYRGAALVYDDLLEQAPDNLEYLRSKGLYLSEAGDQAAAIEVFDEIEKRIGVTERTSLLKFELYKKIGKDKRGVAELERLIETFPDNVNYRHHLAGYFRQIGKKSQMEDVFEGILQIDPDDARANVAMASSYRKQGDHGNYLMSIRPIIENENADIDIKIAEMMPYVRIVQKNPDDENLAPLLQLCELLEKTHPSDAKAASLFGDVLSIANRPADAVVKFKRTIDLNPSNYLVWEQYLGTLAELKMMDDLVRDSEDAMDYFPNQAQIYFLNGFANAELKDYSKSEDALSQALLMAGRNEDLRVSTLALLGKVQSELGNFDEAELSYENALSIRSNDDRIANDYAYHLAQRGERLKDALKMANAALGKNNKNPRYLGTKAWVQYKMGELDDARSTMQKSISAGGDRFGYILENYGDVLYKLKDVDGAVQQWQAAQALGLESPSLDRKIEERKLIDAQ